METINPANTSNAPVKEHTTKSAPRKSDNGAKDAIKAYLDKRAVEDPLFAVSYAKENKSIDECFNYILNEARKRGNAVCMTDEEVFGLAVHYYDEDDIKVDKAPVGYSASTSRTAKPKVNVELTEDEKAQARAEAIEQYQQQYIQEQRVKRQTKTEKAPQVVMPSLFDLE